MTTFAQRRHRQALAAGLILTALVAPGASVGADDDDDNNNVQNGRVLARFMLDENAFNRTVFGNLGPEAVRDGFEHVLALRVAQVDRTCGISRAQRANLELAGKGDIKRHFDRIDDRRTVINRPIEQAEYAKVWQELQALNQVQAAELFGDASLFNKALKATLGADQATRYNNIQAEQVRSRYHARVEQFVVALDGALGLSAAQRRRLVELLFQETPPPRKFGQYDSLYIQYQMSRLPEASLKPIFDEAQWHSLRPRLARAQAMQAVLERNGDLPGGAPGGFVAQPILPAAGAGFR
jgi:hypothetical protein